MLEYRARAQLVADVDADPRLVQSVTDLLVPAGVGVSRLQRLIMDESVWLSILGAKLEAADVVVVLRTETGPTRDVLDAVTLATDLRRPIAVLHLPGLDPQLSAKDVREFGLDLSYQGLGKLREWALGLARKYGHKLEA